MFKLRKLNPFNLPGASSAGITCSGQMARSHVVSSAAILSAVESVDEGMKGGVSELLSEASRLLPSSTSSNAASNSTRPVAIPQKTSSSFEN